MKERTMNFTADQVWGLAVAADRINGGYIKEDVWDFEVDQKNPVKRPNKVMIKTWLREGTLNIATEADIAAGREFREHFKTYTFKAISGQLNEFQQTAMRIAAKEEFTGRDMYDFAVIGCLPDVARRDQAQTELKREIFTSEQLQGQPGDVVVGEIEVIRTRFSNEYQKHKIDARMGESIIDFWFSSKLEGTRRIKGKIKQHRGNKTTQLNFVKIIG